MHHSNPLKAFARTLAVFALGTAANPVRAQTTATFGPTDASGAPYLWNNPALWTVNSGPGLFPDGTSDVANFSNSPTANVTVDLDAARTVNQINFSHANTGFSYTIANNGTPANTLTLAGSVPTINVGTAGVQAIISAVIDGTDGLRKTGAGTLILTNSNIYTGGTTIAAGVLRIGNGGTTGAIGGNVLNNGTISFNRSNNQTFSGTITGNGAFIKNGTGTLTMANGIGSTGALTVMGSTASADSVLDLGGGNVTTSSLTIAGTDNNTNQAILQNVLNLTVNGNVNIGPDSRGKLTIAPGGSLTFTGGAYRIGNKVTAFGTTGGYTSEVDASAASSVSIAGSILTLGNGTTTQGVALGILRLPTSSTGNSSIILTGGLTVGCSSINGGASGRLILANSSTAIRTTGLIIGGSKTTATVSFHDTVSNFYRGGTLTLGGATGANRVPITIGNNTVSTAGQLFSYFDTTGGTLVGFGNSGEAMISTLSLGNFNNAGTGGSATGLFLLDGANSKVDINSVVGSNAGSVAASKINSRGLFIINNGSAKLNGNIAAAVNGASNLVNVFGGTLNMSGNNISVAANVNSVSNSTANATNHPAVSLAGGTLLNAGTITTPTAANIQFNHAGGTLSRTTAGNTTIVGGAYSVTSTAPLTTYHQAGSLSFGNPGIGGATIHLDSISAGNVLVGVAAPSLNRTGTGTLNVIPFAGNLASNERVTFTADPATVPTTNGNVVPAWAVSQVSGSSTLGTEGHYLTHGANGLAFAGYSSQSDINSAGPLDIFNATSSTTNDLMGPITVLGLRSNTTVDLDVNTLTVGTSGASGVLLNGGTVTGGTLAFQTREAVIYAGSGLPSEISSVISGSGGVTFFGSSAVGGVTPVAAGKLMITSDNATNLSGTVNINGGILSVNNTSGSATGTGPVMVNAGGTLAGIGTVAGNVTVGRFGTIAPDNPFDHLTLNANVSFNYGGKFATDLGASVSDSLDLTGANATLNFANGSILEIINSGFNGSTTSYIVAAMPSGGGTRIQTNGVTVADGATIGQFIQGSGSDASKPVSLQTSGFSLTTGDKFTLSRSGDNLVLTFVPNVVPEPTSILSLAAASLGAFGWVRRRRRTSRLPVALDRRD